MAFVCLYIHACHVFFLDFYVPLLFFKNKKNVIMSVSENFLLESDFFFFTK